mmetsp:Transcript_33140/g.50680  ORF Transcript_33140/g.50680 Transcript_33140/m.50680 type:complete len:101 (+) Transcript_33140:1053-1355(+)
MVPKCRSSSGTSNIRTGRLEERDDPVADDDARIECTPPDSSPHMIELPSGATAKQERLEDMDNDSAGSRRFARDQKFNFPSDEPVTSPAPPSVISIEQIG